MNIELANKLLALTASSNENEAAVAALKLCKMLRGAEFKFKASQGRRKTDYSRVEELIRKHAEERERERYRREMQEREESRQRAKARAKENAEFLRQEAAKARTGKTRSKTKKGVAVEADLWGDCKAWDLNWP